MQSILKTNSTDFLVRLKHFRSSIDLSELGNIDEIFSH